MLDRDFANRFLCFYLFGYENYTPDLDTFMSKAMANINNMSIEDRNKITHDYSEAMKLSYKIFAEEAFRKIYNNYKRLPPINKALFDAIATQFALLTDTQREQLKSKAKEFKKGLYNLLKDDEKFFIAVTSSTGDRNRVYYRHSELKKLIFQTIEN